MSFQAYVSGGWRTVQQAYVSGAWRTVRRIYTGGAWYPTASVSNVSNVAVGNEASLSFDTGVFTESVKVERSVNGGGWTLNETVNTSPSSGGSSVYSGSTDDTVQFRCTPYDADAAGGAAGAAVTSNTVTLGGPA